MRRESLLRLMYRSVARMNEALLQPVEKGLEDYRRELITQARLRASMEKYR
jgi:hypothetical protein